MGNKKIRVLLAEEHQLVHKAFATLLSKEPDIQVVSEVASVSDLLDLVKKVRPHVLIMDANKLGGQVILTTEEMRNRYPDVHILVLSAHERREYVSGLLRTGVMGYMFKHNSPEMLSGAVRLVAGREEWLSSRVVDILTKSLKTYAGDPQVNMSAREIWV